MANYDVKGYIKDSNNYYFKDATARSSITTINSNIGDLSATGVTGSSVAAQITALNGNIKGNYTIEDLPYYDEDDSDTWSLIYNIGNVAGSKANKNHRSTTTQFGGGDAAYFGHVKLVDDYSGPPQSASTSVGASQKAVRDLYTKILGILGSTFKQINTTNSTSYLGQTDHLYFYILVQISDAKLLNISVGVITHAKSIAFKFSSTTGTPAVGEAIPPTVTTDGLDMNINWYRSGTNRCWLFDLGSITAF